MSTRSDLLSAVAAKIADYRDGEIAPIDSAHVDRWVRQFDADVQEPILAELDHVFDNIYCSRQSVQGFLTRLVTNTDFTGADPAAFWQGVGFLRIQGAGASQREMLDMFDGLLRDEFGFDTSDCESSAGTYVYLDDGLFSGNRIRWDVGNWLETDAPDSLTLHVILVATHEYGEFYTKKQLLAKAKELGKKLDLQIWRGITLEDRKYYVNRSDVLRPTEFPDDEDVRAYVQALEDAGFPPVLRTGRSVGDRKLFSSPSGRHLLEQEFLKAGVRIRGMCTHLPEVMRPLGFHGLQTPGFGTLFVTFRNCPNNCPLVFWCGDPWYPLFRRKTNTDTGATSDSDLDLDALLARLL